MRAHAILKAQRQRQIRQRLKPVPGFPALRVGQAQQGIAQIAVFAQDVGVGVVHHIMRVPPLLAIAGNVPFKLLRIQAGVARPVVLAMHDVVADFHVVQDLCIRQSQHAGHPAEGPEAKMQQGATADLAGAADADHLANVIDIRLAKIVHHAGADRVYLAFKFVDLSAA